LPSTAGSSEGVLRCPSCGKKVGTLPSNPAAGVVLKRRKSPESLPVEAEPSYRNMPVGGFAKIVLSLCVLGLAACWIVYKDDKKPGSEALAREFLAGAIAVFVQTVALWPLITMAGDTRESRILLERIANKK